MFYGRPGLLLATRIQHDARLHNHCFQDRWLPMLELGEAIREIILILLFLGTTVEACFPPGIGLIRLLLCGRGRSSLRLQRLVEAIPGARILFDIIRKEFLNFWKPIHLDLLHPYDVSFRIERVLLASHLFMKRLDFPLFVFLLLLCQFEFVLFISLALFFLRLCLSKLLLIFIHSEYFVLNSPRSGLRFVATTLSPGTSSCI
mmetsp:Transcript_150522/g.265641  ORF Transcript_150522/g.265641 Transcript_150522/m.265641 type:complete len:203 (-) Transcript_150522:396-1004(-)